MKQASKKAGLKPEEVKHVCADSMENARKLGADYKIETPSDPVKKVNFYTSTAFEGYKRFINPDGSRNYFMWDNSYFDELVKSYYVDADTIIDAYKGSIFNVNAQIVKSPITDEDRLKRELHKVDTKDFLKEIVRQLEILSQNSDSHEYTYLMRELSEQATLAVEAFLVLGKEQIEKFRYSHRKIRNALKDETQNRLLVSGAMQKAVYAKYKVGDIVPVKSVNACMRKLITQNGIPFDKQVSIRLIRLFFEVRTFRSHGCDKVEFLKKVF